MANQKGGLHKQVGAIFDGIPNPNEDEQDIAEPKDTQSTPAPTNTPPQKVFRPDSLGAGTTPERISPKQRQASQPEIIEPPKKVADVEPVKKERSTLLPASLTIKPGGMNLVDTLKVKLNEAIEKHGQRQVVMTMVIPVLAIALVFFLYKNLAPARSTAPKVADSAVQSTVSASFDTGKVEFKWQKPQAYPILELRDPMKAYRSPGKESQIQPGDIIVNGILYDSDAPDSSKAVINGQQAGIGDSVGDALIINIQEEYVEFELGEKIWKQSVGY